MILKPQATRVDRDTGIRETAEFLSANGTTMFSFTHLPPSDALAGVVICSPLYAEFLRNYRREVSIGRTLASRGVAVQRFHYRGHGNSGGDPGSATFDSMAEDAAIQAEHLVDSTGASRLAFFGSRFGALVAAHAATGFDTSPLALWDPILDSSRYFSDMFRVQRLQALKGSGTDQASPDEWIKNLRGKGTVDILGYSVTEALYESSAGRTLANEVGLSAREILVVRMGQDPRLHRGLPDLLERWRKRGFIVETLSLGRQEPWWFSAGEVVSKEALSRPVEVTVDWLSRVLGQTGIGS